MREVQEPQNKITLIEQALTKIAQGNYNDSMRKKFGLFAATVAAITISIDANIVFYEGGGNGALHLNPAIYDIISKETLKAYGQYSGYILNVVFNGVFPVLTLAAFTSWSKMRKIYQDLGLETENLLKVFAKKIPASIFAVIGSLPFVFFVKFASEEANVADDIKIRRMIEMAILITTANLDGLNTAVEVMKFIYKTPLPFLKAWYGAASRGFYEITNYKKLSEIEIYEKEKQTILSALDDLCDENLSCSPNDPKINQNDLWVKTRIKGRIKDEVDGMEIHSRDKELKEKSLRYLINSLICATTMYAVSGYYRLIMQTCKDISKDINAPTLFLPFSVIVLATFIPLIAGSAVKTGEFLTETVINTHNDFKMIKNKPLNTQAFDYFKQIMGVGLIIVLVVASLGSGFSAFDLDKDLVPLLVLLGVGLANFRGVVDLGKKIKDNCRHALGPLASRSSWAEQEDRRQLGVDSIKLFRGFVEELPSTEAHQFVGTLKK